MKIINGAYPPNKNKIFKYLSPEEKIVYTFGDKIFNPHGLELDPGVQRREQKHFDQQMRYGNNKFWQNFLTPTMRIEKWWERYLQDYAFRLAMDLPACQAQYREYAKVLKGKQLENMAKILAREWEKTLNLLII